MRHRIEITLDVDDGGRCEGAIVVDQVKKWYPRGTLAECLAKADSALAHCGLLAAERPPAARPCIGPFDAIPAALTEIEGLVPLIAGCPMASRNAVLGILDGHKITIDALMDAIQEGAARGGCGAEETRVRHR